MKKIVFLTASILLGGFFISINFAKAANTDIIINEIGAYEASDHEWIEIYNKGSDPVDIETWKFYENDTNHGLNLFQGDDLVIEPGEYAIIADVAANFTTDYPEFSGTVIDSSWSGLKESGELIELRTSSDPADALESFTYIAAPDFSLERADSELNDYTETNWAEHASGNTAGKENSNFGQTLPEEDTTPPEEITDLEATPGDTKVDLSWTASASEDATGYKLYIDNGEGFSEALEIGDVVFYEADGLENDILHVFKITAYDESGNESEGTEISATPEADEETDPDPEEPQEIKINEFVFDPTDGENEWIELYNAGDAEICLENWTLEDGVGEMYVFALEDIVAQSGFLVYEIPSSKLNNSGDIITLKNSEGEIIDQVSYGDWDDGDTSDNAPITTDPNSLARNSDGADNNLDNSDWHITETPTKGETNIITSPNDGDGGDGDDESKENDGTEKSNNSPGGGGTPAKTFNPSDLVINELVSDPADGGVEWIELYNNTSESINLMGWYIFDGSETKTKLSGTVAGQNRIVFEKPKGIMNNSGDIIILKHGEKIIDQVCYGDWDDGDISDNAPAADDPLSIARIADGQDTDDNWNDFAATAPTKGTTNVLSEEKNENYSDKIKINEIMPNPEGADNEGEFIELKNTGIEKVNLEGWILGDGSRRRYTIKKEDFGSTELAPGKYLTLYRKITNIALNNSGGDEAKLFSPEEELVHKIKYDSKAEEGEAYALAEEKWQWTLLPTPGEENELKKANRPPVAVIESKLEALLGEMVEFDASDSYDPEGSKLKYLWNFGNGDTGSSVTTHYFFKEAGNKKIILTVTDEEGLFDEAEILLKVGEENGEEREMAAQNYEHITINEFIPNPEGSDAAEWMEIFNAGNEEVDLSGCFLDDEEGGSRPYKIPEGVKIAAGKFLIFKKSETKIALNNSADYARLLDPDENIISEIPYEEVEEGASYALLEKGWHWTLSPTPKAPNKFTAITVKPRSSGRSSYKPVIEVDLENIRSTADIGDKVKTRGVVSVVPGILGKQIFYLAGSGIQIYMYSKNFPELRVGDYIEVIGEISEAGGERRIKIKEKSDIKILEHEAPPVPHKANIGEIGENTEGYLISISGEVIERRGSSIYIDDGSDEIKVYIKTATGIDKSNFNEGDIVEITGIVSQTKSGYRLLPRSTEDVKITGNNLKKPSEKIMLQKTSREQTYIKYLSASTMALTIILGGLMMRMRREIKNAN